MERIKLEEFQKAEKIMVDYYAQDFKEINGHDRPCIRCDARIKPLHPEMIRFPQQGMYSGGVVDKISAGYGSDKDGDMFIIAVCDKCIDNLKQENKIEYAGNYMRVY